MRIAKIFTVIIALLLATLAQAQDGNVEFISGSGRFAIRAGGTDPVFTQGYDQMKEFILTSETFAWSVNGVVVAAMHGVPFSTKPPTSFRTSFRMSPADRTAFLALLERRFAESARKENASLQRGVFTSGTAKGVELLIAGENRSVVRIFFVNDRLYTLLARKPGDGGFDVQKALLDTFRFLPENEFVEALLRESDPAQLPQDVPTGLLPTDAMEKGLKGKVMEIVEEVELLGPRPTKRTRHLLETYSHGGYLTKQVTFSHGIPDVVTAFGWIDGSRAVNVRPISNFAEPYRGPGPARTTIGDAAPEGANVIGRDPSGRIVDRRYTTRFEVKYDDEWRVSERRHLTSGGDVSLVEKFAYTPSGRDCKIEDDRGGFISRKLEVPDNKGNIIEERLLDDRGGRAGRKVFKYEFDAVGNWVVKKEYAQQAGRSRALKHTATYYRMIKYHDN